MNVPGVDSGDYTVRVDGQTVTVEFTKAGLAKLTAGQTVTIEITTTVNDLGDNAEFDNEVLVNVNGSEQTSKPGTVFYGQIQVNKYEAGEEDNTLAGAEFELYAADEDGEPTGSALTTVTTNADCELDEALSVWVGTEATDSRDYVLVETKAPAGYVTPTGDAANHLVTVSVGEDSTVSITVADVANTKHEGPSLPLTGSTGTLMFMILGLVLIATGGTVAAVRHHRAKA